MAHDGQDSQAVPPVIVVDSGDANSGVVNAAESPAAGNGSNNGEHLVDAEEFENMRLAIGTLGKSVLEISLSDKLTGTRHIDIRVRRNNRPQSGGGIVAAGQAVGPGNEAPQEQAPPPDSAAAAQTNRRLKITVAADEPEPEPERKPDADKEYLYQMRGWLMTVVTLVAGMTFQAAIQPPQWVADQLKEAARLERNTPGPAAAPSPDAAHQRATDHWLGGEDDRANMYFGFNGAAFMVAMSLLLVLLLVRGSSTASLVTYIVRFVTPILFLDVAFTFVVAMSTYWLLTLLLFIYYVALAAVVITGLLGKLGGCIVWLRKLICRR